MPRPFGSNHCYSPVLSLLEHVNTFPIFNYLSSEMLKERKGELKNRAPSGFNGLVEIMSHRVDKKI